MDYSVFKIITARRNKQPGNYRMLNASSYIAREQLVHKETGTLTSDHLETRKDLMGEKILLPSTYDTKAARARLKWDPSNRTELWNMSENVGPTKNGRMGFHIILPLPVELSEEQRAELAYGYAKHLANKYKTAVDAALHRPERDHPNYHAHFVMPNRQITVEGLGRPIHLDYSDTSRRKLDIQLTRENELVDLSAEWTGFINKAFARAGLNERIKQRILEIDDRKKLYSIASEDPIMSTDNQATKTTAETQLAPSAPPAAPVVAGPTANPSVTSDSKIAGASTGSVASAEAANAEPVAQAGPAGVTTSPSKNSAVAQPPGVGPTTAAVSAVTPAEASPAQAAPPAPVSAAGATGHTNAIASTAPTPAAPAPIATARNTASKEATGQVPKPSPAKEWHLQGLDEIQRSALEGDKKTHIYQFKDGSAAFKRESGTFDRENGIFTVTSEEKNPQTLHKIANKMLEVMQVYDGKKHVHVSPEASSEFSSLVWKSAMARGMEVYGYTPTAKDQAWLRDNPPTHEQRYQEAIRSAGPITRALSRKSNSEDTIGRTATNDAVASGSTTSTSKTEARAEENFDENLVRPMGRFEQMRLAVNRWWSAAMSQRQKDNENVVRPASVSDRLKNIWSRVEQGAAKISSEIEAAFAPEDKQALSSEVKGDYIRQGKTGVYQNPHTRETYEIRGRQVATRYDSTEHVTASLKAASYINQDRNRPFVLQGSEKFRREAWLVAKTLDIRAEGYTPNESDLAELQKRKEQQAQQAKPASQDKSHRSNAAASTSQQASAGATTDSNRAAAASHTTTPAPPTKAAEAARPPTNNAPVPTPPNASTASASAVTASAAPAAPLSDASAARPAAPENAAPASTPQGTGMRKKTKTREILSDPSKLEILKLAKDSGTYDGASEVLKDIADDAHRPEGSKKYADREYSGKKYSPFQVYNWSLSVKNAEPLPFLHKPMNKGAGQGLDPADNQQTSGSAAGGSAGASDAQVKNVAVTTVTPEQLAGVSGPTSPKNLPVLSQQQQLLSQEVRTAALHAHGVRQELAANRAASQSSAADATTSNTQGNGMGD